jgi:hypothetical protein
LKIFGVKVVCNIVDVAADVDTSLVPEIVDVEAENLTKTEVMVMVRMISASS